MAAEGLSWGAANPYIAYPAATAGTLLLLPCESQQSMPSISTGLTLQGRCSQGQQHTAAHRGGEMDAIDHADALQP